MKFVGTKKARNDKGYNITVYRSDVNSFGRRTTRYIVASEKGDHANRDGEQEPRRQVHLGGPHPKSSDFDHGWGPLARRFECRVTQERNVGRCKFE